MEFPTLMTVMEALDLADEILKSNNALETLKLTTPGRIPEDSMALYAAFMTLASSPNSGGGMGSKPMLCAMEVMRNSDFVNRSVNDRLPPHEISQLIDLLGNAPDGTAFALAVLDHPKTLHPSVDLTLANEAIYGLRQDHWDYVVVFTKLRQRLSIMRRPE